MTRRQAWVALIASTVLSCPASAQQVPQTAASLAPISSSLEEEFRDPPSSARPRVWWHWVNGNVTREGIAKDLAWLKRIGVAGLQNFDASVTAPQVVERRLVYMTPEWKQAFRFAVTRADELGLEYGIAASPGWSETGGPWVRPQDAMKKLVWSKTHVSGGKPFAGALPMPPAVSGLYQDVPRPKEHGFTPPELYRDALVIAYRRGPAAPLPEPARVTVNGAAIDPAPLSDGRHTGGIAVPANQGSEPGVIEFDYAQPQTVRSATVYVANLPRQSFAGRLIPQLETSDDGKVWRRIAEIGLSAVPTTVSFAPVTAKRFRLLFTRAPRTGNTSFRPAPGADSRAAAGVGGSGRTEPQTLAEAALSAEPRINTFERKAGFTFADDYYALDKWVGGEVSGIAPDSVVDLTARMRADGRLDWTPPRGEWTVLRLGYSLTGKSNAPATVESTGLEVDKYDAAAVTRYIETYLGMYRDTVGAPLFGRRGLSTLITESTEVGPSNWTPKIREQFRRLRGYDPLPWLPALTGVIVGSRRQSDAFLYDFRRTLADLTASEHYGTVARVARSHGLTVYSEAIEGERTVSTLGDDLDMRAHADVPMATMWAYGAAPAPEYIADIRGAASVAHLYGRPYVAAESLTSILNPWAFGPAELQPMIDAEFVNGINRPFYHSVVHQPVDERQPGLSLNAFGQYFNRHETWAEMARPWIDYIARTSLLLQQGRNVADVAYFYGEEAPISIQAKNGEITDLPRRYAYDYVSAKGLLEELSVEGGDLISRGGARYKALYLGGTSEKMTIPVLRKLAALVEAGATVIGEPPQGSPSLNDDPAAFASLVKRLWGGQRGVRAGQAIEPTLKALGVAPDFDYAGQADSDIQFVHRRLGDGDIYFLSNRNARAETIDARFRVRGKAPELWRAADGSREPASYRFDGEATVVPLTLAAGESVFVLFRKPAAAASLTVAVPQPVEVATIDGAWSVAFQPGRGAPATLTLPQLASLSEQAAAGVKYFSGIATYRKSFSLPAGAKPGEPLWLDLGKVGDVAEVSVNGRSAGIAWKPPYRLDIANLVRAGSNILEVRVANLWVNRLIGDQQPGATKVAYTTVPTYMPNAPLRPSGLIGPVRLMKRNPPEAAEDR